MTTLEQRIVEALAAHTWQSVDIQGRITCHCGRLGITGDHDAHQATAILPLILEREAEAWDKGCGAGDAYGYQRNEFEHQYIGQLDTPINPYSRSNDE